MESGGRPVRNARVVIHASQFLASGSLPEKHTSDDGLAEFETDFDASAQVSVYVNGQERVRTGPIQAQYKVVI